MRLLKDFKYSFNGIFKQDFPFHDSFIIYILENQSAKIQLKLLQTCKYFLFKSKFIGIENLCRNGYSLEWKATVGFHQVVLNLKNLKTKLWIQKSLESASIITYFDEDLYSAIGKYEVISLTLSNQFMDFKTFKFLISSPKLKHVDMKMISINDEKDVDKQVDFDKIIQLLPKLDSFVYFFPHVFRHFLIPDNTKVFEALQFCNIKYLKLCNIQGGCNIEKFFNFLRKQEKMQVVLCFSQLSEEHQQSFQEVVDHLIESGAKISPKPFLSFPNQRQKTANALEKLFSL